MRLFVIAAVLFFLVLSFMVPIAAIWSLNVIFGLAIPITFKTWLAAWIICGILSQPKLQWKDS